MPKVDERESGEIAVWFKTLDLRLSNIERSTSIMNHELGEVVGQLKGWEQRFETSTPRNATVNPTVKLIIQYVVFPLIIILGSIYGVTNIVPQLIGG